jgi:hypothetical protein
VRRFIAAFRKTVGIPAEAVTLEKAAMNRRLPKSKRRTDGSALPTSVFRWQTEWRRRKIKG